MQVFTHEKGRRNKPNALARFSAVLALSFLSAFAFAQDGSGRYKLDPVFRFLLDKQSNRSMPTQAFPSPYILEPTTGFAERGGVAEQRYNCIVYTTNGRALRDSGMVVNSVLPKFATVWATLEQINRMSGMAEVKYIEAPQNDKINNDIALATSGASLLHAGKLNNTSYKGKGVIVAIYDTGIDWDHPDFRNLTDQTKSRILRIWDQTITAVSGEAPPAGFSYGVEYTQAQLNDELDGSPAGFVREKDINGHGTHVAGTAAGNGAALATRKYTGMAPEADIIIIKGGNGSFPTTNTVDAVTYLKGLAATLGRPIVMNMSIGGLGGPHDGTLSHELAIDDFTTSGTGRAVVISAGNDNGAAVHNRFTLANGANNTVSFSVPTGTAGTDVFQYSCYSNDASAVTATVTAPSGETVTATAGQSVSGNVINSGFTVYVSNTILASDNNRSVNVYVARNGSNTETPLGTWTLNVTNNTTNTLTIDGWLNYISTSFTGTALVGGDNNYLVGSPGNAATAITVASFVGRLAWYSAGTPGAFNYTGTTQNDNLSTFSSYGPRRDGLQKPEITATGQAVISCLSSDITPVASDVVEIGLYQKNQGTSMSAPVVTGAVALLMQTNNSMTAAAIKSAITANATKDALTEAPGATPNTRWGYGKLDVFRAASSVFNCTPSDRRTYQYDISFTSSQNPGVLLSSQYLAVRTTPDISGKLGGAYYHTAATTSVTDLVMEVRANNAGVPGAVLGSINLPVAIVGKYSWNYVDLSSLNITVTSGTDFFVVLRRDASSSSNWSMTRETVAVDGRSLISSDAGVTWSVQTADYRIRAVVYTTPQISGALASTNSTDTRNITSSNQFLASCALIAQLTPNGAVPVTGTVTGRVWLESGVPYYSGHPYVSRHYQITPATGASTATGRVTLYFTQAEFNTFNADPGSALDLPTAPGDAAGKANLRVVKFPGNSSDGSGLPATYTGGATIIDPADADIVWNTDASRWEVSFDVTGFSGFIIQTQTTVLPIRIEYFTGRSESSKNLLSWKANCSNVSAVTFEVERSGNGADFNSIGSVNANQFNCSQPFDFTDAAPLAGRNYYRIKMTEATGSVHYTNIILLKGSELITELYPTVVPKGAPSIQVSLSEAKATLALHDALGKVVYSHSLAKGVQRLDLTVKSSGVYYYSITSNDGTTLSQGKIVVE